MIGSISERIIEHWEIKLVALVIAVALWLYTNGQVRVERTLTVMVNPSAVHSLPTDYRVTVLEPQSFTVQVSVPMSQAGSLRNPIIPNLVISGDAVLRGEQNFPITSSLLGLDDDLRIYRIEPESVREIRVSFALITEDYLPVEIPRITGLPDGIQATLAIEPTRVRVRGTREQLNALKAEGKRLRFDPIVLDGVDPTLQATRREVVTLTHLDQQIEVIDRVSATVTLAPQQGATKEVGVPVQILAPTDFTSRFVIELSQPQVVLALHGPASLLSSLQPDSEVTAYVVLRPTIELGVPVEVPVGVLGPTWATYDPVTIRVTVTLAPNKAPSKALNNVSEPDEAPSKAPSKAPSSASPPAPGVAPTGAGTSP